MDSFGVNKESNLFVGSGDGMMSGTDYPADNNKDLTTIGIAFGAAIGGLIIITLLVVVVICVLVCVLRCGGKDRQQPTTKTTIISSNPVYSVVAGDENVSVQVSSDANVAANPESHKQEKESEVLHEYALLESQRVDVSEPPQAPALEYAYATTENRNVGSVHGKKAVIHKMESYSSSYASSGPGASHHSNSRRKRAESSYYMSPAIDENSLYIQFRDIDVNSLARETVIVQGFLGSGQFGTVHKGVWQSGDREVEVAIKMLKEDSSEIDKIKFLQEAAIMGQFSHPNVVKLHGVVTEGKPIMIVLELLALGDLQKHLKQVREQQLTDVIDEHTLLSYCRQVVSGMCYLANKAFVHRDLAARNILVAEYGICKIADFGMSRDLEDETYYISHGGKIPVKWTAPEAVNFRKYSSASDVWSFGCLMFEIWSLGHKPFEGYSNQEAVTLTEEGLRLPPPTGCPRFIYEITISCWHPLTTERPSFNDLMQKLSMPDTRLLKWSEEDKAIHPEASKLGADLECAYDLYKDLQSRYAF